MPSYAKNRLFKKRFFQKKEVTVMTLQGEVGTATRALYTGPREFPRIEVNFKVDHGRDPKTGQQFDHIEIEMDIYAAIKFADQLLASISAASPSVPRAAHKTMFGE